MIKRTPIGQIIMMNSNFDFLEKPFKEVEPKRTLDKSNTAKAKIEQAFKKMEMKKEAILHFKWEKD